MLLLDPVTDTVLQGGEPYALDEVVLAIYRIGCVRREISLSSMDYREK